MASQSVPASEPRTLEYTPTFVVAAVCTVIVVISLAMERLLHYLGKLLKKKQQQALFQALQKLKEELMLLGFISLLLTVFQNLISSICIPKNLASRMLPCKEQIHSATEAYHGNNYYYGRSWHTGRLLSGATGSDSCSSKGKVPLLSLEALHQLHIFIFVLAVVHVVFCATTMVLGGAKISRWKHWETGIQKEVNNPDKAGNNAMHTHHLGFAKERGMGFWRKFTLVRWMMSFFKQFSASVTKSDYKALRAGFIMKHWPRNPGFDFHKYMMHALEDDFKKVVGISWYLWLFVVLFLLLNVHGWHTYFWLSFLPLVLLLAVGTKLENIITKLALEVNLTENSTADAGGGAPGVKPSDERFWFGKPGLVLYLIHFILFQNSFEIAFFFWIWSTYGFDSCIMESIGYLIPRLVIGVIIQVLCSYSTLPLYAIVTQMGDTYKKAIFGDMRVSVEDWFSGRKRKKQSSGIPGLFGRERMNDDIPIQRMVHEASASSHELHQLEIEVLPTYGNHGFCEL